MPTRAALAKIHIAKKQLGLDEATYRAVLLRATGRTSSKDLSEKQVDAALAEFKRLGFKPKKTQRPPQSKKPQVRKVFALWGELARAGKIKDGSRGALRAFVKRMTGVADPEWLETGQAIMIIEALKAWTAREK